MMKNKTTIFCAVIFFCIGFTGLYAQQTIPASGGEASGNGGFVSYSVGQLFYHVHTGTTGSVAEGVQQPWEISVVTGIQEATGINLVISAFPNPLTDYLTLRIEDYDFKNLEFLLYDVNGKLLMGGKVTGSETTISMTSMVPAVYFLKVLQTTPSYQEVKTFKIIKN